MWNLNTHVKQKSGKHSQLNALKQSQTEYVELKHAKQIGGKNSYIELEL